MIDYFQIQRIASKKGLSEDIIEKDYFIELLLLYLSNNNTFKNNSIFRGGTALKKIYFPNYRFSEDLDFLIEEKENLNNFDKVLDEILLKISDDFPFKPIKNSTIKNDRLQIFIKYDIVPEIKITKELKVDILKDAFIPPSIEKKIIFIYQDFKGNTNMFNVYTLESIVSDKILRILDIDKETRDIYDLWFLLKLNYLNAINVKNILEKKFGYKFYLTNLINDIKSIAYKKTWEIRLKNQILALPPYELVIKELEELIRNKLI